MSPPCRFFRSPDGCRNGGNCRFSHSTVVSTASSYSSSPPSSPVPGNWKTYSPTSSSRAETFPPPGVCRFYWKEGTCFKGFACTFRHVRADTQQNPSIFPRAFHHTNSFQESTPPGVCRYYWEKGYCSRNSACHFQHTQRDRSASPELSDINSTGIQTMVPIFTTQGLHKVTDTSTDVFFSDDLSLSPSDAQSKLARFMRDGFEFRNTFDIYAFLVPLNSASATNKLWKQAEGQNLLSTLSTSSNGQLRILSVINWPDISIKAGSLSQTTLSFQRGILPLLRYLSSEFVVKSTLVTQANNLYTIVLQNFVRLADVIESCMDEAIERKTFKDSFLKRHEPIGPQIFVSIAGLLHELLTRFKNVVASHPRILRLAHKLYEWFQEWRRGIDLVPPIFDNPFKDVDYEVATHIVTSIQDKIGRIASIVGREERKLVKTEQKESQRPKSIDSDDPSEALAAALHSSYEGPGRIRDGGPRHDNDFEDIRDIQILPTNDELMCHLSPFLPSTLYAAPHPAPSSSMQRLLDVQFRLLREELLAPMRKAVKMICNDLQDNGSKTQLAQLMKAQGGKYRGSSDGIDSLIFNVYTGAQFASLVPDRRGLSTAILIDTPPGKARSSQSEARVTYWQRMGSKRLFNGSLVALVWKSGRKTSVHLGIIVTSAQQLISHANTTPENIELRILFFDSRFDFRILQELQKQKHGKRNNDVKFLVESPVMFEAIRPFLEALRVEPEDVPFPRYLVLQPPHSLESCLIQPPRYSKIPDFEFQLSCLFSKDSGVDDLRLCTTDPAAIAQARNVLRRSRLDPSQADAMVDALTREVALIQGPPGTGKSFTGVEILRVLHENGIGPILMIAFTNHALDHMLCSVLDADITDNIVRLGRSEGRLSTFTIETRETAQDDHALHYASRESRRQLKTIQQEITVLMDRINKPDMKPTADEIMKYLSTGYPAYHAHFCHPPMWFCNIPTFAGNDDPNAQIWKKVDRNGKSRNEEFSEYTIWKNSVDLDFIHRLINDGPSPTTTKESAKGPVQNRFDVLAHGYDDGYDDGYDEQKSDSDFDFDSDGVSEELGVEENWKNILLDVDPPNNLDIPPQDVSAVQINGQQPIHRAESKEKEDLFTSLGFDEKPSVPITDRPLEELLQDVWNVWSMSTSERQRLHRHWEAEAHADLNEINTEEFRKLCEEHMETIKICNEFREETRRDILSGVDIIGCTTTGAASLTTLLKGLSPKVLLVEEAGQVLESHVLGSLVPSVEHLILIGDPLQLRPNLNNFALSMDNKRGKALYKFDMSLMERLSTSGLTMSRINEQRRMRPVISSLIRNTLYPGLEDHDSVLNYPNVRGMQKNVFFVTHTHQENDGSDDVEGKYNSYEVDMIRDLVLYLLRQGCYSKQGDIVVLCAYLGQLARLRDALSNDVAVFIDEQDEIALDDQGYNDNENPEGAIAIKHVSVTRHVYLRTVDNFQGEEGRIVILSLVRNAGSSDDPATSYGLRPTIGFLKSQNRTNVAVSRAREGLYIFGNSHNLSSQSPMWRSIIEELKSLDCVGPALPITCHQHPETVEYVSRPGMFFQFSPDGGCLRPCGTRLSCGHLCPFKCHCDDPAHITVVCPQACGRLCVRDHPCDKLCSDPCGLCRFPFKDVILPCGHIKDSVQCHELECLDNVFCDVKIEKQLPICGHAAVIPCGQAETLGYPCSVRCDAIMNCCGKRCNAACCECQSNGPDEPAQTAQPVHRTHSCEKTLRCGHQCQEKCTEGHEHTIVCTQKCQQTCIHSQCNLSCSVPCSPCLEPCNWNCEHFTCPVPCGSICVRLPCDRPCTSILQCGHKCPSVCGEDCDIQICPECATAQQKDQIVDLILCRTLADVMPDQGALDDLLITIPSCRHVFTVETLDGHTGINEFYSRNTGDTDWIALKTPFHTIPPPTCPVCRAPVKCPRYGRIVKRAYLDILERNVACHAFRKLGACRSIVQDFDYDMAHAKMLEDASRSNFPTTPKDRPALSKQKATRVKVLKNKNQIPLSIESISPGNTQLYSIDPGVITVWKIFDPLLKSYRELVSITKTRSAHTQAWESAFSFLYHRELQAGPSQPFAMSRRPKEHAMKIAKLQVGQLRPLVDKRILVETFWETIHIRLTIIQLIQIWLREATTNLQFPLFHRQQVAYYIDFLLQTCACDAEKALEVADASNSQRQRVKSILLLMRISLEIFRFNMDMSKQFGVFKTQEVQESLRQKAANIYHEEAQRIKRTVEAYSSREEVAGLQEEEMWIEANFSVPANIVVHEWSEIEKAIATGTHYQPVSLVEKMGVIHAFNFGSTGHFYTCQNGHIFVITECGGAIERSRCPECGGVVGGTNHQLDGSNGRSSEFKELARMINPDIMSTSWPNPH